ncbi:porin [Vibrio agarivorans]|uniref:Porin n=1 Tax=Vibrio agarivorans TaxID=153622 RepID=A0ABT7Y3F4_9VIBR|nr:porin [Vibrio agarivorans]MDN2482574.1 porin [Vibrio agarivorans]
MNKNILAIAIAAATFGTQAVAVELYNNDGTTFSVGGHVSVNLNGSDEGNTDVGTNSPRINMTATQDMGNGFTVDARGEWALNYLTNGGNSFSTRLGYIGLTHEDMGRAVVGTQWAPYYDVAGVTDMPIAFANDFLYSDATIELAEDDFAKTGQTRADQMISYRNGFEFGEAGALDFGLAWQGKHEAKDANENVTTTYNDRVQVSLAYSIMGAQLGYAYNTGDVDNMVDNKRSLDYHVVSAKYGSYGNGLYLAGVYQMTEDKNVRDVDSYEVIAAYALPNSLNFSINYENVEDKLKSDNSKDTTREEVALQVEYNFTSNVVGYTGYQFDLNDSTDREGAKRKEDNAWTIGARFYL